MNNSFELAETEKALEFLQAFSRTARRKGEEYFHQNRVRNLISEEEGTSLFAHVQGSQLYEVRLDYILGEGWFGECTCPLEFDCKHIYAVMHAAVLKAVGSLGAKVSAAGPGPAFTPSRIASALSQTKAQPPSRRETVLEGDFGQKVVSSLGRPLHSEEIKFLAKLNRIYRRCCVNKRIAGWDFDELGLSLRSYAWDALQIWPAFPKTEEEFWLYIANTALENQRKIPEFLEPVTNLDLIKDRLQSWRRSREIDQWKRTLSEAAPSDVGVFLEADLRLVIREAAAIFQWKPSGGEEFKELKHAKAREFAEEARHGRLALSPEDQLLWDTLERQLYFGRSQDLNYGDVEARRALSRLLRLRPLDSRIVTAQGQPLARVTEPLRWEVIAAAGEAEDYRFQLVQSDGTPAPRSLCTLPGHPPLCLTREALFIGPPISPVLDASRPTTIPAPAMETSAGVAFLQKLGVEPPARVRERIRRVPMEISIFCELKPLYPGSQTENCLFTVLAAAEDGARQEKWTGYAWQDATPVGRPKNKSKSSQITVYDRSLMDEAPRLLGPLGLKNDCYSGTLALRVTRKFPETFVPWLKSLPPDIKVHLAGILASFADAPVSGQVRLDVTEAAIDWFDLHVVLDVSDTTLTPQEIRLLLNAKGGYVRFDQKGWRRLQFNLTEEDDEKLARLGLNPHELTAEPQRLHALQLAEPSAKKFLPEQQVEQIQRRASEIKARVTPDLPSGVTAQLRPYQLEGFHFLAYLAANHFGGILADDMGLGKTLQALAWLAWLREQTNVLATSRLVSGNGDPPRQPHTMPSLVVCPKSVMDNWSAEAQRFTTSLRVKVWSASELPTFLNRLGEADLHVLNYSQLRIIGESLVPVQWLAVILDEGQYIKNPNSQTAQVARALRSEHRLVLSGTPIENRLLDLWSLMAFAMPGILGSRNHFAKVFDSKADPFARRRLSARVRPFLLRRTKSQVAKDLPDRTEEDLFCEIEGEQKALYRAELKRAQQMLLKIQTQKELAQQRFHFLTSLLRLRQICCHPALVKPESKGESAKLEALLEQIEPVMEEGHKVLVFSQFVEMLALIKPAIAARGWPMFYLAGETENRGELVRQFQSAQGAAVFLISLKAGGFGLNLMAASYVVLFDPWWNPAVENQAIDRAHRIGQVNKVIAYRLLIKNSIEEKIRALQKQKSALAEDVLGEEKFSQSLTLSDLQFLFAD